MVWFLTGVLKPVQNLNTFVFSPVMERNGIWIQSDQSFDFLAFEYQNSKSPVFKWFRHSSVWYLDPHFKIRVILKNIDGKTTWSLDAFEWVFRCPHTGRGCWFPGSWLRTNTPALPYPPCWSRPTISTRPSVKMLKKKTVLGLCDIQSGFEYT